MPSGAATNRRATMRFEYKAPVVMAGGDMDDHLDRVVSVNITRSRTNLEDKQRDAHGHDRHDRRGNPGVSRGLRG